MPVVSLIFLTLAAADLGSADKTPDPAEFNTSAELMKVLNEKIKATPDAMVASRVANDPRYMINVVHRAQPAGAGAHPDGTELHYIIEGSGTIVTGGTLNRSGKTVTIDGGVTRHVAKGDTVLVPAGTPHWYKEVDGSITYLEVRFNVGPKK
jgi:glc operon protein GlcG